MHTRSLLASVLVALSFLHPSSTFASAFDPRAPAYEKQTATCKAVLRSPPEAPTEVDIDIRYVDINPNIQQTKTSTGTAPAILMVHGWPSVWSTWGRQIEDLEDKHRLIVPNLRGFGDSGHPGDVRASGTSGDMVNDLVCVLQAAGISQAICMGHDWGTSVCYEAARARPDVFVGVIAGVLPYIPSAGPHMVVKDLVPHLPKLAYQLFFDSDPEAAAAELDADVKRTMRATLRSVASPPPDDFLTSNSTFLGGWGDIEIPPVPFFSSEEEDYYVEEIGKQGFKYTLQFYTGENRHQSWEIPHTQGNHTITQPVLAIYPTKDPVADWVLLQSMAHSATFIPDLSVKLIEAAHWVHLEKPQEFNSFVREWLDDKFGAVPQEPASIASQRHDDEL